MLFLINNTLSILLVLKEKFYKIRLNKLFAFSLILFLLPSFRSGAIWANTQITALIFFLISLIYFVRWLKKNNNQLSREIFLQCLFLSLAVYSRQLYAYIFIFFLFNYYLKLDYKKFLKVSFLVLIFSIPGILLVLSSPRTLTTTFNFNFSNTFLVNTSIISFYLIPIFFLDIFKNFRNLRIKQFILDNYISLIFSFLIISFASLNFNYNASLGGGFFIKLSILLFDNLLLFYLTSIVGFFLIIQIIKEDKKISFLFLLLIFGISSYQIFQKYFEPMFIILLFSVINLNILKGILENLKSTFYIYLYFLIYLISALINDIFKITKTFV